MFGSQSQSVLQALLISKKKFKLIEMKKHSIYEHFSTIEKDYHTDDMSDKNRISILKKSIDNDTLDLLNIAEEQDALRWAKDMGSEYYLEDGTADYEGGQMGRRFVTPTDKVILHVEPTSSDYTLDYASFKRLALCAILGDDASSNALETLNALKQNEIDTTVHIVRFRRAVLRYAQTQGTSPDKHMISQIFYRSLDRNIRSKLTALPSDLNAAYKAASNAHKVIMALQSTSQGQSSCNLQPTSTWTTLVHSEAEPSLRGLAGVLGTSAMDNAEHLASFCNLPLQRNASLSVKSANSLQAGVKAALPACTTAAQAVNAISHLLPNSFVRKTAHSSETTQHFDLSKKSKQELKESNRKARFVNKLRGAKRNRDDSDSSDSSEEEAEEEKEPERPNRRSGRPKKGDKQIAVLQHSLNILNQTVDNLAHSSNKTTLEQQQVQRSLAQLERTNHQQSAKPTPFVQVPFSSRPCRVCNGKQGCTPWEWQSCPDLFENGVKLPFCVVCRKKGHEVNGCPVLANSTCRLCSQKGHRRSHCPRNKCSYCKGQHEDRFCPNKQGGRG